MANAPRGCVCHHIMNHSQHPSPGNSIDSHKRKYAVWQRSTRQFGVVVGWLQDGAFVVACAVHGEEVDMLLLLWTAVTRSELLNLFLFRVS